jgi:hypothetical protein
MMLKRDGTSSSTNPHDNPALPSPHLAAYEPPCLAPSQANLSDGGFPSSAHASGQHGLHTPAHASARAGRRSGTPCTASQVLLTTSHGLLCHVRGTPPHRHRHLHLRPGGGSVTESGESLLVGAAYSLDVNNQTPGYGPGDVYWPWEATARSGRKCRKRVSRLGVKKPGH